MNRTLQYKSVTKTQIRLYIDYCISYQNYGYWIVPVTS